MGEQIQIIRRKLAKKLSPARYEHSLSVSFICTALAMRYDYDLDKAELAGLLHDCAKRYQDDLLIEKCRQHGVNLTGDELLAPAVIHAKYGAWMAEHKYGIQDKEILSAIRFHTTGCPDMTTLEKIVWLADYIEPRRAYIEQLPRIRKLAFQDLDLAIYEALAGSLAYLQRKGAHVDLMSQDALDYYQKLIQNRTAKGEV